MWAVITLISLFVLLIIILCIPVDILFSLNTRRNQWFEIYLNWWFGLVRINLRRETGRSAVKRQELTEKKKSPDIVDYNTIIRIIRIKNIFRRVYQLIRDLIHTVKIKIFNLDMRIGLEDPVDNGYLFACITPLNYLLSGKYHNINIQPVFENELVFDSNVTVYVRTFPILIVGSVLGFIFSRPVLEAIGILWNRRWHRKSS